MPETTTPSTEPEATPTPDPTPAAETPDATPDLGDAGRKALAAERAARKAAEKAAAEAAAKVAEYENRDKTETEKAAARAEAAEKRAAEAEAKALRLEVADEMKVPANLRSFLTATTEDALREQATALVNELAAATASRAPRPDPAQGAKPGSAAVPQLTRAELAAMTPAQINAARDEGRLNDVLAGKS